MTFDIEKTKRLSFLSLFAPNLRHVVCCGVLCADRPTFVRKTSRVFSKHLLILSKSRIYTHRIDLPSICKSNNSYRTIRRVQARRAGELTKLDASLYHISSEPGIRAITPFMDTQKMEQSNTQPYNTHVESRPLGRNRLLLLLFLPFPIRRPVAAATNAILQRHTGQHRRHATERERAPACFGLCVVYFVFSKRALRKEVGSWVFRSVLMKD